MSFSSSFSRPPTLAVLLLGTGLVLGASGCSSESSSGSSSVSAPSTTQPSAPASNTVPAKSLGTAAFAELVQTPGTMVIDVRTPQEFSQGHLANAKNYDVRNPAIADELEKLNKTGTYAVYCRSGNRSLVAQELMLSLGFTKVSNLTGGITAWTKEGRKVVTGS